MKVSKIGRFCLITVFCLMTLYVANAFGSPAVSYTTSGSPGNWSLEFSVTNTLGGSNEIYFWGVNLPTRNITGTPTGWRDSGPFSPSISVPQAGGAGGATWLGSNRLYVDSWLITADFPSDLTSAISNGQTLSFDAMDISNSAPTSIAWFAFSLGGTYLGNDNLLINGYPGNYGFEGLATNASTPVPVPSTMLLLGSGLLGLIGFRKKFRQ